MGRGMDKETRNMMAEKAPRIRSAGEISLRELVPEPGVASSWAWV